MDRTYTFCYFLFMEGFLKKVESTLPTFQSYVFAEMMKSQLTLTVEIWIHHGESTTMVPATKSCWPDDTSFHMQRQLSFNCINYRWSSNVTST